MNKKLVSLSLVFVALIAVLGGTATTQADNWIEYRAADNSFTVDVLAPFHVTSHQIITPMGPVAAPLFTEQEGGDSFFVSYVDLPKNYLATTSSERILESGIVSTLQAQGGQLVSKSDSAINSTPGKEITGTIRSYGTNGQDMVMRARVFLSKSRHYYVYFTGAASEVHNTLAARYLDSFRIMSDVARR